jgi:hypothetical protein
VRGEFADLELDVIDLPFDLRFPVFQIDGDFLHLGDALVAAVLQIEEPLLPLGIVVRESLVEFLVLIRELLLHLVEDQLRLGTHRAVTPLQTREVVVRGCGGWIQDAKESLIPGMLATTRGLR